MQTKIILEICYNHNGSMELAKKMIDQVAELGVWGVKFQKWEVEEIPKRLRHQERSLENSFGETYLDHRMALEFSIDQLKELREYTYSRLMEFVVSGKDFTSIKKLVEEMKCGWIKIPSQREEPVIIEYLKEAKNNHNIKIMMSTGMRTEEEIKKLELLKIADVKMHCISLYPAKLENCDFGFMKKNMDIYNGYSSHEIEGRACKYAVMLGVEWIERHFTFDKKAKGSDHKMSSDMEEMKRIIEEIKEAEEIRGNGYRNLSDEEKKVAEVYKEF